MTTHYRTHTGALRHPLHDGHAGHPGHGRHLRKDPSVNLHDRVALALAHERQAREQELVALERRLQPRVPRSLRRRVGRSLVRLGERVAAEPSAPAWTG